MYLVSFRGDTEWSVEGVRPGVVGKVSSTARVTRERESSLLGST